MIRTHCPTLIQIKMPKTNSVVPTQGVGFTEAMLASGAKRHAQHRRQAPSSAEATPAALGMIEGTGFRQGYHNQSLTLLLSATQMEDLVAVANLLAVKTGRLVKNSSPLLQLASRLQAGDAERDLIAEDFISFLRDVTAARREYREQHRGQRAATTLR